MVQVTSSDLKYILDQIRIAEANAAGTPLSDLITNPDLALGLRTVSGVNNNLIPGQENWGAADQPFPQTTTPTYRPGEPVPDGFPGAGTPTSYDQTSGNVFDSDPRLISNLISDQTSNNPAAVAASGITDAAPGTVLPILNTNPTPGLPPTNSIFTLFGQFFDHGLDLVPKGGSGTVFIPLKPDDPLYVPGSPANFMVLTRATNEPGPDGILGTADDVRSNINLTTPFVDQNQTYTSHPSHQVFLREYALDAQGHPVATGGMLSGANGGPPTWADIKAQAASMLGIDLTDADVTNLPLLATDDYGKFIPGANGLPQIVLAGDPPGLLEGSLTAPISTANAVRTGHAFLDDIAHNAVPRDSQGNMLTPDADDVVSGSVAPGTYDDELLDAHYIVGDGRGNENIGLTTIHHVFHAEHNLNLEKIKATVLASNDAAFIAEWLLPDADQTDGVQALEWNGERLFQAARFYTEMEYQHIVFEEFARTIQPNINPFAGYAFDIDPSIVAEFAHVVYRFGHSMLPEVIARTNADGTANDIALLDAFTNPLAFAPGGITAEQAAGAIARGMANQASSAIDEFVVDAVRNNLLGLPLDLVALNIARGRDAGVPSFNEVRREFFAGTGGDPALKPYTSWADFGFGLTHPESLINFIAAYGKHSTILAATDMAGKRAAAAAIVFGGTGAPEDRLDFLNSTGAWASAPDGITTTGLDDVDFWIGGLAEKPAPFGGLLGSTFNYVFQNQLEHLQDGDRFYYLGRTPGMTLEQELEQTFLSDLIMSHTDAAHLPAASFSRMDFNIKAGDPASDPAGLVARSPDGTVRFTGTQHVVLGGTANNDHLISSSGNDALFGDEGNDTLEGGLGDDTLTGGAGDDTLTDTAGNDVLRGGDGNDSLNGGAGADALFGGDGNDYLDGGTGADAVNGGVGNDIMIGGADADIMIGGEDDDWVEGGVGFDALFGDNNNPFGTSEVIGHDVLLGGSGDDNIEGENGDDIMLGGNGTDLMFGRQGFDWTSYDGEVGGIQADLMLDANAIVLPGPDPITALDRFFEVEGLSGSTGNDQLRGDNAAANGLVNMGLINGLSALLGGAATWTGGNIILGGAGSDTIEGRGGNDFIDGDAFLRVSLSARGPDGQIIREIVTPASNPLDVDTAVYSDIAANYDITRNADGTYTVAHLRGTHADGTDTLRNIEMVQFSDKTVDLGTIGNTTIGTGSDTLVLRVSQNAYLGNAQYTISVDGVQIGDILSASALHSSGLFDTITLHGDWAAGNHTVSVSFLNDRWGGSSAADRNLYVDGMTYNGATVQGGRLSLASNGEKTATFVDGPSVVSGSTTVGTGSDTLVLKVSQDAYLGDAQYTISVDGVKVDNLFSASALHSSGLSDTITLHGDWAAGNHTVSVSFLNDRYGGSPAADRNLYVDGMTYNGATVQGGKLSLGSNGERTATFIDGPSVVSGSTTVGTGSDTLVLKVSQTAYLGDAQYTISVDGVQIGDIFSASALHSSGLSDIITVHGEWAAGSHTVSVNFLNDRYGGSPAADRNLYVDGMTYNGVDVPGSTLGLATNGEKFLAFQDVLIA